MLSRLLSVKIFRSWSASADVPVTSAVSLPRTTLALEPGFDKRSVAPQKDR